MMANIITSIRIFCSMALLFYPFPSAPFYLLYLAAGISDMVDGTVARKTGTVSEFGSKLDSVADFILVAVCLIKILPVLDMEAWILIWIGCILLIKIINVVWGFILQKTFVSVHSVMNKITGGLVFIFPLTVEIIDLRYSAAFVCVMATFAAMQEGYYIRSGRGK